MKFAFDVDDVLRDTLGKMRSTYEKFFIEDYVQEEGEENFEYGIQEPIDTFQFENHFKFPSNEEFINFLYFDFPMNIYGHAPSVSSNTFNVLMDIQKNVIKKRDKISFISKSIAKQKPATLFFLSKYGAEADQILFYNKKNQKNMWSSFDVIITANPELLSIKPKNKIAIKYETTYNDKLECEYTIKSLEDFTSIYKKL